MMGGGRRRDGDNSAAIFLMVILVSIVVYVLSFLLLRALSRYREFAADRGAAIMTGAPAQLASALAKISGTMDRVPTKDLRAAEGMNAFFIIPAVAKGFSLSSIVSTHPPVEKRIERLMAMQATLDASPVRHRSRAPQWDCSTSCAVSARPGAPTSTGSSASRSAALTLEASLGLRTTGRAGVCFRAIEASVFSQLITEIEELLAATSGESGTTVSRHDDSFGFSWVVISDPDVDDLATTAHVVCQSLEERGLRGATPVRRVRVRRRAGRPRSRVRLQAGPLLPLRAARRPHARLHPRAARPGRAHPRDRAGAGAGALVPGLGRAGGPG